MRHSLILLIFLGSLGCARFQQAAAPVSPPSTASAQAQVTDATLANFECSDGTIASSLGACLANMAHARLPPSQQVDRNPIRPVETTTTPTGTAR